MWFQESSEIITRLFSLSILYYEASGDANCNWRELDKQLTIEKEFLLSNGHDLIGIDAIFEEVNMIIGFILSK